MKTKNVITALLMVESALVLITLLLGRNAWVGVVCYWAILLMKNTCDYIDEKRKNDG